MDYKDVKPQLEKLAGEFQYKDPPDFLVQLQEMSSYILRAVADFLRQFRIILPGSADTSAVGNLMQILIFVVGAICLVAVLYVMFNRMKHLKEQAQLAKRGALSLEEILDSKGWQERAATMAQQNNFGEACRALYLSILYRLDESQILAFTPTRSNYEYWYALAGKEGLQRGFRRLSDMVELMWFGEYEANADDYAYCHQLFSTLESELKFLEERAETKS